MNEQIEELIVPTIQDMGLELVKLHKSGKKLEIMVEKADGSSASIDECGKLATAISAVLDVEDIISSEYLLEVGSAGMDRPVVKISDYEKFLGRYVKVEGKFPLTEFAYRKFKAFIKEVKGDVIIFEKRHDDNVEILEVEHDDIKKCNLEISEEMIKKILQNRK